MPIRRCRFTAFLVAGLSVLAGCSATDPTATETFASVAERGPGIAALDYHIGDLSDPAVLAKYSRADVLIVNTGQFWDGGYDLAPLRAAKPDLKILAYFRTKHVPVAWAQGPPATTDYYHQLYLAAEPYLSWTTTGDTISDWPRSAVFDFTNPASRAAMLDVFVRYQESSPNRFDGVFWDYFAPRLWIPATVTTMEGEPDMDGDGIPHQDDPDELAAFVAAQDAWVDEMRAALGGSFIQIGNGVRACRDSTFAAKLDGMFYENFPDAIFAPPGRSRNALDPAVPNNLFAARNWPRRNNGGPWLILSNMYRVGGFTDNSGVDRTLAGDEFVRIMALLTDCYSTTYEGFGTRMAGVPEVEYDLGKPLGPVVVDGGTIYRRQFQRGSVTMTMGTGDYPVPFTYFVRDADGRNIQVLAPPYAYP